MRSRAECVSHGGPSFNENQSLSFTPVCTALSVQKRSCRDADPTGSGTMGSGPAPGIHAH